MSMKVELGELAERLGDYGFAYLVTVGDDDRAHVLAVMPKATKAILHRPAPGEDGKRVGSDCQDVSLPT